MPLAAACDDRRVGPFPLSFSLFIPVFEPRAMEPSQTSRPPATSPPPVTQSLPPARKGPAVDRASVLAAAALAVAVVALLLTFAIPGPAGSAGSPGPTGPPGPQGATNAVGDSLWAVISSDGSIVRSVGVTSAGLLPNTTGQYFVSFGENVSSCSYIATLSTIGFSGSVPAGNVTVAPASGTANSVYVGAYDGTGAPVNESFQLTVHCQPGLWATISETGATVGGTGVASSSLVSTGEYQIIFSRNVSQCGILATPGLTAPSAAPPGAESLTVASSTGVPDGISVTAYNSTGALTNASFHLSVLCSAGLWAVVASNGVLDRGSHVISASQLGGGSFQVIFDQNITGCSFVATLGETSYGTLPAGAITLSGRAGTTNGVYIEINYGTTPEPFHLGVFC